MKKYFKTLVFGIMGLFALASCEDVPMPYPTPNLNTETDGLIYSSTNLGDFSTFFKNGLNPWSIGSTYTQATGYQAWDGGSSKANKEVEGWLVSSNFSTVTPSSKAKFYFDNTIRYTDRVAGWEKYHKIYISSTYVSGDPSENLEEWTEIEWAPIASTYSDWTLYTSGEIQIPEEFVNKENVHIAFWFYAPATASTTWELQNFNVAEGVAGESESGEEGETIKSSKESPLTVAQAKTAKGNQYVKGYIVGYVPGKALDEATFGAAEEIVTNLILADSPSETDVTNTIPVQLPAGELRTALSPYADNIGHEVILYGSMETYFGTNGVKNASWAMMDGKEIGKDPDKEEEKGTPEGDGTKENPFNVAAAIAYINTLGADVQSEKEVYIKGKVLSNTTTASTISLYGNMTFTMVDEGSSNTFTAYQVYGPGQKKFTSADQIKANDEVVVCGKVVNYRGNTPETVGKGASYVVTINGEGEEGGDTGGDGDKGEAKGTGTQADPYNVAGALAYITTLSSTDKPEALVYTKGKISEVVKMGTSGSIQFKMADEGVENSLLVYYCDNLGKASFKALTDLKVGDEVIVCGKVVNYSGNTPEYTSGAYLVSLNGKTESEGGDKGDGDKGDGNVSQSKNGTTLTFTLNGGNLSTSTANIDLGAYGESQKLADGTAVESVSLSDGGTITFEKGTNTNAPKYYNKTKGLRIYGNNVVTISGKSTIAKVDITCDGEGYMGNDAITVVVSGNTWTITNAGSSTTQLRAQTITVTYAK